MTMNDALIWTECHFSDLTASQFYAIAKLRVDVFVVEQACAYPEFDGQDLENDTVHVFAMEDDVLVAYARVLAPRATTGATDTHEPAEAVHIGRVVVAATHRRRGLASELMQRALAYCETRYPAADQALAAQVEVQAFYASLGFEPCSASYLEDGIAHIDMRRVCGRR